jgi:hypothetical protein
MPFTSDILGVVDEETQRQYSYFITDLRTNEVIAELPFQNVTYATVLSGVGEFSGDIIINPDTVKYASRQVTTPGRTGLYVMRDDQPVWGGIIWKRRYNASQRKVSCVGSTFESYLGKRLQPLTHKFENTDQLDIARWLLENDNLATDLLATVSSATSPRKRERQMYGWERKTVLDEMTRLGNLIDGFDWNVLIRKHPDSQEITRHFEFFYPKRGVSAEQSTLMFEYPGSIRDFELNEDALDGANEVYALGAGEGVDQKFAVAVDAEQAAAGYPRLQETRAYSSVVLDETLQAHAVRDLERLRAPVTVFEVVVDARTEPVLGSYSVGDWARFRMEDEFVTPAVDQYARITGISVTVDDSTGLEQVTITLGGDEVTSDEEEAV